MVGEWGRKTWLFRPRKSRDRRERETHTGKGGVADSRGKWKEEREAHDMTLS